MHLYWGRFWEIENHRKTKNHRKIWPYLVDFTKFAEHGHEKPSNGAQLTPRARTWGSWHPLGPQLTWGLGWGGGLINTVHWWGGPWGGI